MTGRRLRVLTTGQPIPRSRLGLRALLWAVMVFATGFSAVVWGWNPYDTDSGRGESYGVQPSSPGSYLAPGISSQWTNQGGQTEGASPGDWDSRSRWYLPEQAPTERWSDAQSDWHGWESDSAPESWAERQRWEDGSAWREDQDRREPRLRQDEYTQRYPEGDIGAGPPTYWSEDSWRRRSLYDDFTQSRRQPPLQNPDLGAGRADWGEERYPDYQPSGKRSASKPREDRFNGYRFRHDPELTEQGRGRENGWAFRPLTERDQERLHSPGLYPRIDERDYIQRGPWRSYQDEGTAFGYHAEDRAPSGDNYWGR